jgi:cytochrome P450
VVGGGGHQIVSVGGFSKYRLLADFYIDPVRCLDRNFKRYGRAVELNGLRHRHTQPQSLILAGPDFNRQVLTSDQMRLTGIWPVKGPDGSAQNNLRRVYLGMPGSEHARLASPVYQHLSRARIDGYFPRMRQIAVSEIETWPAGSTADVHDLARRLAQRYAISLLFGEDRLDRVRMLGNLISRYHGANWSRGAQWPRWNFKPTPYHAVLSLAELQQQAAMQWNEEQTCCPAQVNLRNVIANAKDADGCPMAAERVAAQLSGLLLASYETTALSLTWALFLLTQHPHVMADLTDELSALPPTDSLDVETLSRQPLLDGVIKETMRLITPVPVLGFKTVEPCEIAGRELTKDVLVMISPHLTHRLPEIFEAPDRFRPQRWLQLDPTAYEYLPFSAGWRRCPGYWFALQALKVALAVILPRYRLSVAPGARIDRAYAAVTVPKYGLPMKIMPQDRDFRVESCTGTVFDMFVPEGRVAIH